MRVLEKITRRSTDVLSWIAGIMIIGMMLLAVLDVVPRTLLRTYYWCYGDHPDP